MKAFQLRRQLQQAELDRKHQHAEEVFRVTDEEIRSFHLYAGYETPEMHLYFERVTFRGDLLLEQVHFRHGISFIDCDFRGRLSLSSSQFHGPAYFWKCRFHGPAHFSHIVVLKKNYKGGKLYDGEANFSYCEFRQDAFFRHAVFNGPTYFHRSVFRGNVDFEVARFEAGVLFASRLQDVCVSKRELPPGTDELLSAPLANAETNILIKCEDRDLGYYNFNQEITSRRQLEERLTTAKSLPRIKRTFRSSDPLISLELSRKSPGSLIKEADVKTICDIWESYATSYMFNGEHSPNFMEAHFGPDTWFRHLSLRRCQLRRANLSRAQFEDVKWGKERSFSFRRRAKVYDDVWLFARLREEPAAELWKWSKGQQWRAQDAKAISSLYHQLRLVAEASGERGLARDFYYGEMEMARVADPVLRRPLLAYVYKVLSGYGTQENRAAIILLSLLLVVFPSVYWVLDVKFGATSHCTWKSELLATEAISLEAATFLLRATPPVRQNLDERERLTESVERLAVSVQATLFVLSLKSRFQRGQEG